MTHESMYFRDHLKCGHSVLVEVLVPIDPHVRCTRDVGSFSFCPDCSTGPEGMQVRRIVRTDHVLDVGVWADAAGALHLDLAAMCAHAGFEPTEANQAILAAAAREQFDGVEVSDE